jgi:hypothetical protein
VRLHIFIVQSHNYPLAPEALAARWRPTLAAALAG